MPVTGNQLKAKSILNLLIKEISSKSAKSCSKWHSEILPLIEKEFSKLQKMDPIKQMNKIENELSRWEKLVENIKSKNVVRINFKTIKQTNFTKINYPGKIISLPENLKPPDFIKNNFYSNKFKLFLSRNVESKDMNKILPEKNGYEEKSEPTRYGDWEVNGRVSDF